MLAVMGVSFGSSRVKSASKLFTSFFVFCKKHKNRGDRVSYKQTCSLYDVFMNTSHSPRPFQTPAINVKIENAKGSQLIPRHAVAGPTEQ